MIRSTLDHYENTAARYVASTFHLNEVKPTRDAFLSRILHGRSPSKMCLLDAGSGSGRDTLAFLQAGFEVDAFDGSEALAAHSSALTGKVTQVMTFEGLDLPHGHYDGIWAMASLLHMDRARLPQVMVTLMEALKPGGQMTAVFKLGDAQRYDGDGRCFTDLNPPLLDRLLADLEGITLVTTEINEGPDTATGHTSWFSVTLSRGEGRPCLSPAGLSHQAGQRQYAQGQCDDMALALASLTHLPTALWMASGPDPDDPDEMYDEPIHAVVVLDPVGPVWADAQGIHEGVPPHLVSFRDGPWSPKLQLCSIEETSSAFTCQPISNRALDEARSCAIAWGIVEAIEQRQHGPASAPNPSRRNRPR